MFRITEIDGKIESTEQAVAALEDVAGFLDDISNAMRSAGMANEDAAQVLVADAIGIAFCRLCDVANHLRKNSA